MNCHEFERIVLRLARRQLLEAASLARGRAHTEDCDRCATRLAVERALIVGVRVTADEIEKEEAPARLESQLLRAFQEHTTAAALTSAVAPPAWQGYQPRRALVAVAAIVLISISALAIFRQPSNPLTQQNVMQALTSVPSIPAVVPQEPTPQTASTGINDRRETAQRQVKPRRRQGSRRQPGLHRSREAEVTTHFLPLMDADNFNTLESGQVVRLQLPGSALEEVGLPAGVGTAVGKTVTADVVIGPDGLAHAIRFIP